MPGQVVACTGLYDGDGDFNVTLSYHAVFPAGGACQGEVKATRNDLKTSRLPRSGVPVAVIAISPSLHRVL